MNQDTKDRIKKRYSELKEQGKSFFPYSVAKDLVACLLVFAVIVFLAAHFGAELEDLADPSSTSYNPRPEWYFLFLFQLLKYFPGKLEALATIVLPGLAGGLLLLMPFLDRGPGRHPLDRPWWTLGGVVALVGVVFLTVQGALSPTTNPTAETDPVAVEGRRLFTEMRCGSCHSINGRGGVVGPALDDVGARRSKEWMEEHFRNPRKVSPGSVMPSFGLLPKEVEVLSSYLSELGAVRYSAKAPALFKDNCMACHRINGVGDSDGPDLSKIGLVRDAAYIEALVHDPEKVNPEATMPAFEGQLGAADIKDISYYVAAQKGPRPADAGVTHSPSGKAMKP